MDARTAAFIQGTYYLGSGVWPLIDMDSFEAVTGPKTDKWLVRTVGMLIAVAGGVMVSAAARRTVNAETATLAIGSAVGLAAIDVFYAARGRISNIYLADALIEAGLVAGWAAAAAERRR
jgi:hypothetical protein